MSILRNLLGAFMPHFESRQASGNLAAVNAELAISTNGDASATVYIDGGAGTLNVTYVVEVSPNGTDYYAAMAFPYAPGCVGGTLPVPNQPLVSEAVNTTGVKRALCVACGGMQKIRVRISVYGSGTATVNMSTDVVDSISPFLRDQKAGSLMVTATGAASAAVTATLPAVAGLRHYVDRISVVRSATAALTAGAAPTVVTTTNLPGSPALTFGNDAAAQGIDRETVLDFGGAGLGALLVNTATTIVAPIYTGVIWRINVSYRLGL